MSSDGDAAALTLHSVNAIAVIDAISCRMANLRGLRLGGLHLGDDAFVDLVRAFVGVARLEAVSVAEETVLFGKHSELHREHDLRADIDVGGREAVAADVI